jgi:hypothetical protein
MEKEIDNKIADLINSLMDVKRYALELLLGGIPEEVKKHIRTSYKERLLALRALLDTAITRLEKEKETEKKKTEKVKIE